MPLLFGIAVGGFVLAWIWAVVGPFIALLNFVIGRFLIASIIIDISLFCESMVWDNFHVELGVYRALLILGVVLELLKWGFKRWWVNTTPEERFKTLIYNFDKKPLRKGELTSRPMRDITPQVRRLR